MGVISRRSIFSSLQLVVADAMLHASRSSAEAAAGTISLKFVRGLITAIQTHAAAIGRKGGCEVAGNSSLPS